jgi:hypothetical protein
LRDENKALPALSEAETLLAKAPDGPGSEVNEARQIFIKKSYTWRGLVKSHTLTAYYTKEGSPALHHFETEGAKYQPEPLTGGTGLSNEELANVRTKNRGPGAPGVPAKTSPGPMAKTGSEAPAKGGSQPAAATGSEPPATTGTAPASKTGSESSSKSGTDAPAKTQAKDPSAPSSEAPPKESVAKKAPDAPK